MSAKNGRPLSVGEKLVPLKKNTYFLGGYLQKSWLGGVSKCLRIYSQKVCFYAFLLES